MTATVGLFGFFGLLMLLRIPVAISLTMSCAVFLALSGFNLYMIPQRMFTSLDSTTLMAIPGFVFAGAIMAKGGIAKYLINALRCWLGHLPGGLAVVAIFACALFAAISGSSPATAAAIGSIMIPAMVDAGYDKKYSMGLVAAAGTLGILIPPSVPMIIYGTVSESSIGKLFTAGIIPGIMLTLILMVSAVVRAKIGNHGREEKVPLADRWKPSLKAIWAALLPVVILGGIYGGIVTPTEASVLAAVYAIIVSVFIYRELSWTEFKKVAMDTVNTTGMIFLIIAGAMIFGMYLTNEQIPQKITAMITDSNLSYWGFLVIISLVFFVLGTFLEAVAIILITLPLLMPVFQALNINIYHFAVIMVINLEIAMITPPVGLNLFVVSSIGKSKLGDVVKGVFPFIGLMIIGMIITMIFPKISLFLVDLMK
ncbi:TRAP transporter large permease [Neobacillus mesonae]|uniref:TRAP transporter large permease n=1 Tax=Neobacillus mesonae TaxID=1193713 RepID=UPI00203E4474|nr:TRAP transporter large permease [Neobacillus mesonae]MCM3567595.1 TRAP transporter large permease [Neobacillus mesonae]